MYIVELDYPDQDKFNVQLESLSQSPLPNKLSTLIGYLRPKSSLEKYFLHSSYVSPGDPI